MDPGLEESFRRFRKRFVEETPEQAQRRQRRDAIVGGLMLIGIAIVLPLLYPILGAINLMSGTSPMGWTITIVLSALSLATGVYLLARRSR